MLYIPLLIFLTLCPAAILPMRANDIEASKAIEQARAKEEALAHYSKIMEIKEASKQTPLVDERMRLLRTAFNEIIQIPRNMFCSFTDDQLFVLVDYFINSAYGALEHPEVMSLAGRIAYSVLASMTPKSETLDALHKHVRSLLALPHSPETIHYRNLAMKLCMQDIEIGNAKNTQKRNHEGLLVRELRAPITREPKDSGSLPSTADSELEGIWDAYLAKLNDIKKTMHDKKTEEKKFSDYVAAAITFSRVKEPLRIRLLNAWQQTQDIQKRFSYIPKICAIIHPFPTSEPILTSEQELLEMARKFCVDLVAANSDHKRLAFESCTTIQHLSTHLLSQFSGFLAMNISDSMETLLYVSPATVSYEAYAAYWREWNTLIQASQKNIVHFRTVESIHLGNGNPAATLCTQVIARAYERLGHCCFHAANYASNETRSIQLKEALDYYNHALNIYLGKEEKSVQRLQINKLHALYELQKEYAKRNPPKKSYDLLKEMELIIQSLDLYKTGLDHPIIIFFHLSVLAHRYKMERDGAARDQALNDIHRFHAHFAPLGSSQIAVLAWLKHFSVVFGAPQETQALFGLGYTMAPLTENDWLEKRSSQLVQGLLKIETDDFAQKYKFTLRQHQKDALNACLSHVMFGETSGYFYFPCGAGKMLITLLLTLASEMPTLIIVPSTGLMNQTIAGIKYLAPDIPVTRFDGRDKDIFNGYLMVTTYANLERDAQHAHPVVPLEQFGIIWADEAHNCLTPVRASLIKRAQAGAFVFGLTARDVSESQPQRQDLAEFTQVFGEKIFEISLFELVKRGELAPIKNVIVHAPALPKDLPVKPEYTDAELETALNLPIFNTIVCDMYLNEYDPTTGLPLLGQPALIFCTGVAHAEAICKMLVEKSRPAWNKDSPIAACIHSKVSLSKRKYILQLHAKGDIPVLIGDKALEEGHDIPTATAACIGFYVRPRLPRNGVSFKESCDRLLRKRPGKSFALIFDWIYPSLQQLLTKDLFNGQTWVGLNPQPVVKPQRITYGYKVDWGMDNAPQSTAVPQPSAPPLSVVQLLSVVPPLSMEPLRAQPHTVTQNANMSTEHALTEEIPSAFAATQTDSSNLFDFKAPETINLDTFLI